MSIDQRHETWRSLQLRVAPMLADPLNRSLDMCFAKLLASLEEYLSSMLVSREDAQRFLRMLPVVRTSCNEDIYDLPMAAEAYAYTHLADRYLRWWTVFHHLLAGGWFPLRTNGIDALDAGSGPGAATYALIDYLNSLRSVAPSHLAEAEAVQLQVDLPRVELSERSVAMGRFVHRFSEARGLGGPYHVTFPDAFDIKLATDKATNAARREALLREIEDEWDTGPDGARFILNSEYPDWHKPHRFHLCMFSYLLTTRSMIDGAVATMRHIRRTLPPGGLVVVMGGRGGDYANINLRLRRHMRGLHRLALSGSQQVAYEESARQASKQFHVRVGRRALALAGEPENEDGVWLADTSVLSMWDPDQMPPRLKKFGIEAYRASDSRGAKRKRSSHH